MHFDIATTDVGIQQSQQQVLTVFEFHTDHFKTIFSHGLFL